MITTENNCPNCKVNLDGDPIPVEIRDHYGDSTHWDRKIGIEDPMGYDGVSWWRCPDCDHVWKAFPWSPDYRETR